MKTLNDTKYISVRLTETEVDNLGQPLFEFDLGDKIILTYLM